MSSTIASRVINYIKNTNDFTTVLRKVKIVSLCEGSCTAELKIENEHTNHMGGLHGGLSATLVDCISSFALSSYKNSDNNHVSVDMHITYMKGAKVGDEITIDATTTKAGKSLAFLDVLIKNKSTGDILVKGSHTKYFVNI